MKTTEISFEQFTAIDYQDVAVYYIRLASGDYLYLHTKSRKDAQAFVDELYGKGHYKLRVSKNVVSTPHYESHSITARG